MKKILLSFLVLISVSSFTSPSLPDIINAMKSGDASKLAQFFDNTVEVTLPGKSNSYSTSQAELVVRDFFSMNPVKNFKVIHKSDNESSQYCIGNLETANGVFRTTIFIRAKNGQQVVQEIRFEK